MFHKMIVKTQTVNAAGRATSSTEHVRHIPAAEVADRRETARQSAPAGSTRTIRVVDER
jgi:hypothetical protein